MARRQAGSSRGSVRESPPRVARPAPPAVGPRAEPSRAPLWIALGLAVATVALYWPVHGFDFVNFDDVDYVRQNAPVRAGLGLASIGWAFTTFHAGFWIPLTWLSLMLDSQLFGTGAGGYHVTNVVLHVANTVLLFALLARATGRPWPSALVAGLFGLHPLHVESVAWITERKDVLSTLFLLLTLGSYGGYVARPSRGRYLATLGLFTLGLMAKPMLTTVPLLLLLLDFWPLRRFARVPPLPLLVEKVPFLVLALGFGLLTMVAGRHLLADAPLEGVAILPRLAKASEAYVTYLVQTVWPVGLAPLYPDRGTPPAWRATLAALALVGATVLAVRSAERRPWLAVGWLWYVVALLPVSGIVKIGPFNVADRFTYAPLIGIFVVAAWAMGAIRARNVAPAVGAVVLAAAFVVSRLELAHWRDGIAFAEHLLAVTGDNSRGQYLYGLALADRGHVDEAMGRYAEALRLDPTYAHAHASLGLLLAEQGRIDEAVAHYTAALAGDPRDAYTHGNLANALLGQGRAADALPHYEQALAIDPGIAEIHNSYGKALAAQGRSTEAAAEYATALRLDPADAEAHNNTGNALADAGRVEDAIPQYMEALRLRPSYAAAHVNLGLVLAQQGKPADAAEHYTAALRLAPDYPHLHGDLGNALAAQGKLDGAIEQYMEALRRDPGWAGGENNLANALVMRGRVDDGIAHYGRAIRLDPQSADPHFNLAMVLAEQGRTKDAIEHYAEAVRLRPTHAEAHRQLGLALRAEGRNDEAAAHLREALRLNPGDTVARQALAAPGGGHP